MHSKMLMALEGKKIDKRRVKREVQIKKEQNFETTNMCVPLSYKEEAQSSEAGHWL